MYFSISSTKIVGMEQTGYVSKICDTGNYKLHHDYIFDSNNNILVLASEKEAKTLENILVTKDLQWDYMDIKQIMEKKENTEY